MNMALRVEVTVLPAAGHQKIMLDKQGRLKVHLKSQAEKGKANIELLTLFAKKLKIPRMSVELLTGATSRKKIVLIEGIDSLQMLYDRLAINE